MQYRIGIKLAGSALALMLISATSFSQDFTSLGNLTFTEDISVQYRTSPVFADIDKDGDLDLFVGNKAGFVQVFTNDGSGNFSGAVNLQADAVDIDVGEYSTPTFADIDGDDDLDLYVGNKSVTVKVFTNDGSGNFSAAGNLQADGADLNGGAYSAPEFADLDGDDDLDLYVGSNAGTVKVFTNDGTGSFSAAADLQADGVDIYIGTMYSEPVFEDLDGDNDLDLYIGENYGQIKVYTNDGTGTFSAAANLQANGTNVDVGYASTLIFADIDDDGDLDLYAGEYYGSLKVFTNDGTGSFSESGDFQVVAGDIDVSFWSKPVFADIDGDNDLDLYVGETNGAVEVFMNDGNNIFSAVANLQADGTDIDVGNFSAPVFANIDGDSDLDLYIGEQYGKIKVFTNDGTGTFSVAADLQADGADIDVGDHSTPVFADIDGDSDLDLYVGESYGNINVFINDGTGAFSAAADLQAGGVDINAGDRSTPAFEDVDGDGDLDLYAGEYYGNIKVFTNDGTGTFSAAGNLQADGADIDVGWGSIPVFASLDGCTVDLFIGNSPGNISVYKGTDIINPTITCVGNQEVDADDSNSYTVAGTEFDPTETDDNCGVASIIHDFNSAATLDGATLPEGTTSVIWTVADDTGNEETCSFDIEVNVFVGVNELSESGISIYPNPSNGIFTIETDDSYIVSVIDISGKLVKEFIINNSDESIDLRNHPKGVYFIIFKNDKTVSTAKIIVE